LQIELVDREHLCKEKESNKRKRKEKDLATRPLADRVGRQRTLQAPRHSFCALLRIPKTKIQK
jgi:hypothetical protein